MSHLTREQIGRASKRLGDAGEEQAQGALRRIGINMIHEIGTPVTLRAVKPKSNIFEVHFKKKVAGDVRGIYKGTSVLAETKTIFGRNLQWSDLLPHQVTFLSEHDEYLGISLLVWVSDSGVHIMRWPVEGFGPGKGITKEHAEEISINSEKQLAEEYQ